jgi:hypothetical protein
VPVQEPAQPRPSEAAPGVGIGISGGERPQKGLVGQIGLERLMPFGTEDLQQRVVPRQAGGAALDQVECILVARRSGSPGPMPRSGCTIGSRASNAESSRSLLVCLAWWAEGRLSAPRRPARPSPRGVEPHPRDHHGTSCVAGLVPAADGCWRSIRTRHALEGSSTSAVASPGS